MDFPLREFTWCLEHQAAEDQMSPCGLVCPECKRRLYTQPPVGMQRTFWESQPAAWTVDREPCFVYSLLWDDCRIRSLHAAGDEFDIRSRNAPVEMPAQIDSAEESPEFQLDPDEFFGGWSEND
jgi:hypothetical protein